MSKNKVKAVFESELEKVLKDLDLWEQVNSGVLKCSLCGEKITLKNLQYIIPHENKISLGCDKPNCISRIDNLIKHDES